jgi:hypothetical protein
MKTKFFANALNGWVAFGPLALLVACGGGYQPGTR